MGKYLVEIEKARKQLKGSRKKFWLENKKNFDKNIKDLFEELKKRIKIDKKWKIYITAFSFISDKEIKPYDYNSFSSTNLIAASKKQGFEIGIFLNRARLGFLSKPALIPIVLHELKHAEQASKTPKEYLFSIQNDKISEKLEKEAEQQDQGFANPIDFDEFRKQEILESVLYCYDARGWKGAEKMAEFWHKKIESIYGSGYLKMMKDDEYKVFLDAKRKKEIGRFIEFFR